MVVFKYDYLMDTCLKKISHTKFYQSFPNISKSFSSL